ncbi:MAG: hypothetical protein U9N77_16550 [Thermodesulfobacteriota bacterium]|nr:hypothetical protein [Thermodesulfobacteriota bacterium]
MTRLKTLESLEIFNKLDTVKVVGFRFKQFQDEVVKFMGISMMNSW